MRHIHIKEVKVDPTEKKTDYIYRVVSERQGGLDKSLAQLMNLINVDDISTYTVDILRDQNAIMSQYLSIHDKLQGDVSKDVLMEWDYEKNGNLKPDMFYKGSHRKVWWKCKKGHSYLGAMYHRMSKDVPTKCPYCANQKVLKGFNDLLSVYPNLVEQWNYDKNDKGPSEYTSKSYKKVWWKCDKGHEWEATINKRVMGRNCPICSGKRTLSGFNDLASLFPSIAKEWNYEKNGELRPENVTKGSNKILWWRCKEGHEWQAMINKRTSRNSGCPLCKNTTIMYNNINI
jgi:hypothetical protein